MPPLQPLHHALYTNASGGQGQGFRHLALAPEWPAGDRQRLGRWLETLRPADAPADERLAVNSFRIGRVIHACLARVDAGFARDEHGRQGGLLVHALLTPLDETRPAGDFTGALLEASRAFEDPGAGERPGSGDADRLEAYLERCRDAREVALEAVDPEAIRVLDADFLIRFHAFSSATSRVAEAVFAPTATPLAEALAAAAAGLPPRLCLACRWAVGLRPVPETTFVARTAADGERPPPVPAGPGAAYAEWLRAGGEPPRDWDIRSWAALMERIR